MYAVLGRWRALVLGCHSFYIYYNVVKLLAEARALIVELSIFFLKCVETLLGRQMLFPVCVSKRCEDLDN